MTPEERAAECVSSLYGLMLRVQRINATAADPIMTHVTVGADGVAALAGVIASAIRAAVVEERDCILTELNALAEQQLVYAKEAGPDGDRLTDKRTAYFHAANMLGMLRSEIGGGKSP